MGVQGGLGIDAVFSQGKRLCTIPPLHRNRKFALTLWPARAAIESGRALFLEPTAFEIKMPALVVVRTVFALIDVLAAVTVAPGIRAPLGSLTGPEMAPIGAPRFKPQSE